MQPVDCDRGPFRNDAAEKRFFTQFLLQLPDTQMQELIA